MTTHDARACAVSGATPAALQHFERALAAYQGWRAGVDEPLAMALAEAPGFVMAHVLRAGLLVCGRDPQRARRARPLLAHASTLPANERERLHLAALAAASADDFELAKAHLAELLHRHPRDVLALQLGQAFDYVTGDAQRMRERVESVLPNWSDSLPGHHAVLAMHAFAMVECGEHDHAEQAACAALARDATDVRAHHVMAHVFEMTDRPAAGQRWLSGHLSRWADDSPASTHCWWHLALFHLAQGRADAALLLYDRRIRAGHSAEIADLIDAAALLWRIGLAGGDGGPRWGELAAAWAPHIDDAHCSFSDLHAMLAFVGAHDWARARQLEQTLARRQSLPTRHGLTTRSLGLPACRALIAFGRGDDTLATTLLASLPAQAHRLGGSHAQRDVLHLTLLRSIERMRRPVRRPRAIPVPIATLG